MDDASGSAAGSHVTVEPDRRPLAHRLVVTEGGLDMIGRPMPLALGYIRRYPWMTDDELGSVQMALAATARRRGYTLGTVHLEELPTDPQAFDALLASLDELEVRAVLIPSKAHLGPWDSADSKYERLRQRTTAEVVVLDPSPRP